MGKLVTIVGNLGVGKTTLMQKLVRTLDLEACWENPEIRPFQERFYTNPTRWALANQIDFLLHRGEQEAAVHASHRNGIMDGSLDQDYFIFTRHLHESGILPAEEYTLCRRMYSLLRAGLPAPDVVIYLHAPLQLLIDRRERRGRVNDRTFMTPAQLETLESYFNDWLYGDSWNAPVLAIESNDTDGEYDQFLSDLTDRLDQLLANDRK